MKDKVKSQQAQASATACSKASTAGARGSSKISRDADEAFDFLAPPQGKDELGRLGHYRVLKVLGRGGMGVVFQAEDSRLHRKVALKVMLPSVAVKKTARERFKREARLTAKIEHDHIVAIYEVNEENNLPFLAMQNLKGMTLDDWFKTGRKLKISQIMRIGRETAKGLAAAHGSKLIHRDIKPSNIFLDAANKGRVKILDFGLARPTDEDTELTHQGTVLGTPAFMSPEQARGAPVDERSDLFSLGCVLYRMCAGQIPFSGNDVMSVLYAINNDDPPPLEYVNSEAPAGLVHLIHQLLEKKPDDRLQTAQDVVEAMQVLEREWGTRPRNLKVKANVGPSKPPSRAKDAAAETEADAALDESVMDEKDLTLPERDNAAAKKKYAWIAAGVGLLGVAGLGLALAVGLGIWLFSGGKGGQGQVRLVAADDATRNLLREAGITLTDKNNKKYTFTDAEQWIPPGEYTVDPANLSEKLFVEPESFTLNRGETFELKVHALVQSAELAKLEEMSKEQVTAAKAKELQMKWAKALARPVEETNSIGMKLTLIPGGVFSMGSTPDFVTKQTDVPSLKDYLKLVQSEAPQHKVRITRPFALGKYEVTVEQFRKFVKAEGYRTEMEKSKKGGTGLENGRITRKPEFTWEHAGFGKVPDQHPVSNVTWADAEAFCKWLSKKENKYYRLPTEAEWEFACRAGTTTAWNFGDNTAGAEKYMVFLPAGTKLSTYTGPHAVGGNILNNRKPNDFGLYDMHGNVEEMCSDIWSADYYAKSPEEDPSGPHADSGDADKQKQFNPYRGKTPFGKMGDKGRFSFDKGRPSFGPKPGPGPMPSKSNEPRVARGGSFTEIPQAARSAFRNSPDPTLGYVQLGFRVVCEISLPE